MPLYDLLERISDEENLEYILVIKYLLIFQLLDCHQNRIAEQLEGWTPADIPFCSAVG